MSNQIVAALERAAKQIVHSLGEAAAKAERRLLHETAEGLEATAHRHRQFDTDAAGDLERAAARHPTVHAPHGASDPLRRTAGAGPSVEEPRTLPGAEPLPDPTGKLSTADHPYLRPISHDREAEAIPGPVPPHRAYRDGAAPPGGVDIDDNNLRTFSGPVRPYVFEPGRTYYRSVGDEQYPNGSFWSEYPPTEPELRRDFAVLNEWNGDHGVVAFTPDRPVHGWAGDVAPQPATGGGAYLPGGGTQIWIPRGTLSGSDGSWEIAPAPERMDP